MTTAETKAVHIDMDQIISEAKKTVMTREEIAGKLAEKIDALGAELVAYGREVRKQARFELAFATDGADLQRLSEEDRPKWADAALTDIETGLMKLRRALPRSV